MILICGASGLVGNELCKFLDKSNIEHIGTYNKRKIDKPNMFSIDFSNPILLEEFLTYYKITTCVFCIVERITDVCETNWNDTKKTNIDLVHITSYICNKLNIKFIHLSTDYVFDGSVQPNFPNSIKNPLQNYGTSKLISELRVIKNCKNYCIIRTPVLYSNHSDIHQNAVCLIGKNIMDLRNNTYVEDNYSIRRPLYVLDLCYFIRDCIFNNYFGIYHFYNPYNKYTKYEMCKIIGQYLQLSIDKIIPIENKSDGIAARPFDTQLNDYRINILNYNFHKFDDTIEQCFYKFKHPKLSVENKNDFFICLDLDGTIIETNQAHYNAYKNTFENHGKDFLNIDDWNNIILNDNIDNYLNLHFNEDEIVTVKHEKTTKLVNETITFTNNSDIFIQFLIDNNINFCVVTNTNKKTVEIFKQKLPLLNNIKQWIYREDYTMPKPDTECYYLAKQLYYKNENYIIGFEDSMVGYNALKGITDLIYIYDNETIFKNNDCFLFNDYNLLIISKIIYTKNEMHLGDCIYSLIFFYNIHEYLEKNNIVVYFYCSNFNYPQINDFNNLSNVKISSLDYLPNDKKIYDLWIGTKDYDFNWQISCNNRTFIPYDVFFCKFYNNVLKTLNIPITINKFIYKDNDLFKRCTDINLRTGNYYDNIDFLINNGIPRSGQIKYDINAFDNFIIKLSEKYNIVTTQKIENIKCTRDHNLLAKDIAAISLNSKNFICIESGVIAGLYNEYIADNPDKTMYNLSIYNVHKCSFNNFKHKHNLDELHFLIENIEQ